MDDVDICVGYAQMVDFSRGFSKFHVKWRLKKVEVSESTGDPIGTVKSTPWTRISIVGVDGNSTAYFATVPASDVDSNEQKSGFLWTVRVDPSDVAADGLRWFGLRCVSQTDHPIPVLFRMAIHSEYNNKSMVAFSSGQAFTFDHFSTAWSTFSESEISIDLLNGDDLSLHLYLAIPKKFTPLLMIANGGVSVGGNQILDRLLHEALSGDKPFGDEENENGNESDSDSDVSVIIVDRNSNKTRNFECHRFVLRQSKFFNKEMRRRRHSTSKSKKLDSMLSKIEEEPTPRRDEFKIDDVDVSTMESVLRFLYVREYPPFDSWADSQESLLKIASAAVKFELSELVDYCNAMFIFRRTSDEDRLEQLLLIINVKTTQSSKSNESVIRMDQLEAVCIEQLVTFAMLSGRTELFSALPIELQKSIDESSRRVSMTYESINAGAYELSSSDVKETFA